MCQSFSELPKRKKTELCSSNLRPHILLINVTLIAHHYLTAKTQIPKHAHELGWCE